MSKSNPIVKFTPGLYLKGQLPGKTVDNTNVTVLPGPKIVVKKAKKKIQSRGS